MAAPGRGRDRCGPRRAGRVRGARSSAAPAPGGGPPCLRSRRTALCTGRAIGTPAAGRGAPEIAHVAIADLDRDGLNDVLVCDAFRNLVSVGPSGAARAPSPSRRLPASPPRRTSRPSTSIATAISICWSPRSASSIPTTPASAPVIVLENDGRQRFTVRTTSWTASRASPTRAPPISTATAISTSASPASATTTARPAGWRTQGGWRFEQHVLQRLSGGINAHTRRPRRRRPSRHRRARQPGVGGDLGVRQRRRRTASRRGCCGDRPTPTSARAGCRWSISDRDGDPDILYANGDAFEYAPPNSRPWQGIQWLENRGQFRVRAAPDRRPAGRAPARRQPISTATATSTCCW